MNRWTVSRKKRTDISEEEKTVQENQENVRLSTVSICKGNKLQNIVPKRWYETSVC